MMDYAALQSEIQNDPKGLGYAALASAGATQGLANLLNSLTGPGAETVSLAEAAKGDVLLGIAPAALSLPNLSPALQAKWDRAIGMLGGAGDSVAVGSAALQGLLAAAVADGVLTQGQVDAFTRRTGSRAEKLFGPGTVVSAGDVSAARGGAG